MVEDGGRWEGEGIGDDGYGRRLLVCSSGLPHL